MFLNKYILPFHSFLSYKATNLHRDASDYFMRMWVSGVRLMIEILISQWNVFCLCIIKRIFYLRQMQDGRQTFFRIIYLLYLLNINALFYQRLFIEVHP